MPPNKKRYVVNFPGHLADCEFNYRRLRKLMPGWPGNNFSGRSNDCRGEFVALGMEAEDVDNTSWHYIVGHKQQDEIALTLLVIERAKYTTTLHIAVQSGLQKPIKRLKPLNLPTIRSMIKNSASHPDCQAEDATIIEKSLRSYSLDVRLYHDARVAEVVAWKGRRHFKSRNEYPNRNMYHRDEKAQLNRFLGELLEFCLVQGRVMHDIVTVS